jgi:gliding motility-associated-like protein
MDEVEITVEGSIEVIRANKAFSPNGDGIDVVWIIEIIEAIEECKLSIFNRAGQQVFEASPYYNNWDGTQSGQPLPSADYYYIIQCNGEKVKSGGIRVLR